jgi:hypothetical protein
LPARAPETLPEHFGRFDAELLQEAGGPAE